jgi:hypothetical protein
LTGSIVTAAFGFANGLKSGPEAIRLLSIAVRFKTPLGFRRFVTKHGGNENFSRSVAAKAGLEQTSAPMLGDVGLVYADGATMAIKADGSHWIVKRNSEGVAIGPFRHIVAWML